MGKTKSPKAPKAPKLPQGASKPSALENGAYKFIKVCGGGILDGNGAKLSINRPQGLNSRWWALVVVCIAKFNLSQNQTVAAYKHSPCSPRLQQTSTYLRCAQAQLTFALTSSHAQARQIALKPPTHRARDIFQPVKVYRLYKSKAGDEL